MARYENLPIYKKTLELAVYMESIVHGFPRYHKYAIGADMRMVSRSLVSLVIKANSSALKREALTELRDRSEDMKVLIIMAKEVKSFRSFREFQQAATLAAEICRQSEGWLRSRMGERPESLPVEHRHERAEDHCAPAPPRGKTS